MNLKWVLTGSLIIFFEMLAVGFYALNKYVGLGFIEITGLAMIMILNIVAIICLIGGLVKED